MDRLLRTVLQWKYHHDNRHPFRSLLKKTVNPKNYSDGRKFSGSWLGRGPIEIEVQKFREIFGLQAWSGSVWTRSPKISQNFRCPSSVRVRLSRSPKIRKIFGVLARTGPHRDRSAKISRANGSDGARPRSECKNFTKFSAYGLDGAWPRSVGLCSSHEPENFENEFSEIFTYFFPKFQLLMMSKQRNNRDRCCLENPLWKLSKLIRNEAECMPILFTSIYKIIV